MIYGKIYMIKSKQTDKIYIGSTKNTLNQRFREHKTDKTCTSQEILKYSDAEIELLECYECQDVEELELREAYFIREYKKNNLCVNKKIPHRTPKEYHEENKEEIAQKKKEYRENNKEKIAKQKKELYEKNKERINEKIECPCGGKYTRCHKSQHFKTKMHLEFLTKQN